MDLAVSISIVGDSVPENASAAFPFLKAKAEDQTELAFNPLGLCYLRGIGTPVNEAEARVWLMKSVKNPDLGGMLIPQCRMLTAGSNGYPRNPNLAMELLRAASEAGNTAAKIQLARMEPDAAKSLAELRSLSDGGNMQATYELGLRYQNGDRAPLNTKEALALFRASAAKGFSEAMYHLGILYQGGILVKRDETQAAAWYQKAKAAGNPFAAARLKPDGSLAPLATPPRVAPDTIVTTYTTVEPK